MSPRYDSRLTAFPSSALGRVNKGARFAGGAGSWVGTAVAVGSGVAVAVGSGVGAIVAVGSGAGVAGGAGVSIADDELAAEEAGAVAGTTSVGVGSGSTSVGSGVGSSVGHTAVCGGTGVLVGARVGLAVVAVDATVAVWGIEVATAAGLGSG